MRLSDVNHYFGHLEKEARVFMWWSEKEQTAQNESVISTDQLRNQLLKSTLFASVITFFAYLGIGIFEGIFISPVIENIFGLDENLNPTLSISISLIPLFIVLVMSYWFGDNIGKINWRPHSIEPNELDYSKKHLRGAILIGTGYFLLIVLTAIYTNDYMHDSFIIPIAVILGLFELFIGFKMVESMNTISLQLKANKWKRKLRKATHKKKKSITNTYKWYRYYFQSVEQYNAANTNKIAVDISKSIQSVLSYDENLSDDINFGKS